MTPVEIGIFIVLFCVAILGCVTAVWASHRIVVRKMDALADGLRQVAADIHADLQIDTHEAIRRLAVDAIAYAEQQSHARKKAGLPAGDWRQKRDEARHFARQQAGATGLAFTSEQWAAVDRQIESALGSRDRTPEA